MVPQSRRLEAEGHFSLSLDDDITQSGVLGLLWCHRADVWKASLKSDSVSFPQPPPWKGGQQEEEQEKEEKKEGLDAGNHEGEKETDAGVVSKKSRMERKLMEG